MKLEKLLLVCLTLLLIVACSDDDNGNDNITQPGENSTGTFLATIDGQQFEAYEVKAYIQQNFTVLEAEDETSRNGFEKIWIKILIRNLNEPRIYAIGEDGNGFIYNGKATINYINETLGDTLVYSGIYVEDLSLIDVTTLSSSRIGGTVGFRAYENTTVSSDTLDLRNGRFNITF
jgi:hypothetical protein